MVQSQLAKIPKKVLSFPFKNKLAKTKSWSDINTVDADTEGSQHI